MAYGISGSLGFQAFSNVSGAVNLQTTQVAYYDPNAFEASKRNWYLGDPVCINSNGFVSPFSPQDTDQVVIDQSLAPKLLGFFSGCEYVAASTPKSRLNRPNGGALLGHTYWAAGTEIESNTLVKVFVDSNPDILFDVHMNNPEMAEIDLKSMLFKNVSIVLPADSGVENRPSKRSIAFIKYDSVSPRGDLPMKIVRFTPKFGNWDNLSGLTALSNTGFLVRMNNTYHSVGVNGPVLYATPIT